MSVRGRSIRGATCALVVLSLVAGVGESAYARPSQRQMGAKLAQAQRDLHRLDTTQSLLDEEYDQAVVALQAARARLLTAQRRETIASRQEIAARRRLSVRARAAYEGIVPGIAVVLGSVTPQDLADRLEYIGTIAASDQQLADRAEVARQRARAAAREEAAAVTTRSTAVATLQRKRAQLVSIVGRQERLISELRGQIQQAREQAAQRAARRGAREARRARATPHVQSPAPTTSAAPANPATPSTSAASLPGPHSGGNPSPNPPAPNPPPPPPTPQPPPASHPPGSSSGAGAAVRAAYSVLGVPYVYAGSSPSQGFDCSGLTMWAWAHGGVSLPHSSAMQYAVTRHVPRFDLQPGDLLFFYTPIHHVAMYVGGGMMIEAPHTGSVVRKVPVYWQYFVGAGRPGV